MDLILWACEVMGSYTVIHTFQLWLKDQHIGGRVTL